MNSWLITLYLFLMALIPTALSIGFFWLKKKTKFSSLNYWLQQSIIGVTFGGLAIFATHFGVDVGGAVANIRDSAPLCSGLIFGGPAGVIAGLVGGIERLIVGFVDPVSFGYTQVACSVSTIFAGIYALFIRKVLFEDKCPSWPFAFFIGGVMEVFHMTMVFLTHVDDLTRSFEIIKILSVSMILTNAIATMVPVLVLMLSEKKKEEKKEKIKYRKLTNRIQAWMLASVVAITVLTTVFTFFAQSNMALINCDQTLGMNIKDVVNDLKRSTSHDMQELSDKVFNQISDWRTVDTPITSDMLIALKDRSDIQVDEINFIEKVYNAEKGMEVPTITVSSIPEYAGFVMDGEQTKDFNVLLQSDPKHVDFYVQDARENDVHVVMKYAGCAVPTMEGKPDSYVQIGYTYDRYSQIINARVKELSDVRHVGASGKVIVADKNQKIVSEKPNQSEWRTLSDLKFDPTLEENCSYLSDLCLNGDKPAETCYYSYAKSEFYYVISAITENEVLSGRDNMIYFTVFMEVIILAILFAIIYKLLMILVVNNLVKVNKDLGRIMDGDLNVQLNIKGTIEFASLSNDINSTVNTLKRYIEEAKHRIDEELKFAKSIQLSALPTGRDTIKYQNKVDVIARMFAAKEVGGDFYDYYQIDANRIAFMIADVSGKGIPAAMFMMESKAIIKNCAFNFMNTGEIIEKANDELSGDNEAGMFVTAWFGIIELDTMTVHFTSAGHNPPLLYKKSTNKWEFLKSKRGLVLAAMKGMKYVQNEVKLEEGDKILLYTDGVTEATRGDNVLYGEDRLLKYLDGNGSKASDELLDGLKGDLDNFVEGAPQFDDITMVVLDTNGVKDN
ncbi:MAG: SpoIIE family protein phosphatase [Bacilli bacterium]|nr:SpoIIE family protein phosphatase [Bacilli bacterium]